MDPCQIDKDISRGLLVSRRLVRKRRGLLCNWHSSITNRLWLGRPWVRYLLSATERQHPCPHHWWDIFLAVVNVVDGAQVPSQIFTLRTFESAPPSADDITNGCAEMQIRDLFAIKACGRLAKKLVVPKRSSHISCPHDLCCVTRGGGELVKICH